MATCTETWYFIVNPKAGSGKTMTAWEPAEKQLRASGVPFITSITRKKRHATDLAYDAAAQGYRRLAAVGGDGTLHEVYNGILRYCDESGTDTEAFSLAAFPIGSGNDWIKSTDVPLDCARVVHLLQNHSVRRMDVVSLQNDSGQTVYMANVGGTGFDARVCERVNLQKELGIRGKFMFLKALIHTIFHVKPIPASIIADGVSVYEGACYSVALGNGPYSGSGMRQVPLARIDDGWLDYMIVPAVPVLRLLTQLPRLFNGHIDRSLLVRSGRCHRLQILPHDENLTSLIEVDGEIEGHLPADVRMDGRQIYVLTGKGDTGI